MLKLTTPNGDVFEGSVEEIFDLHCKMRPALPPALDTRPPLIIEHVPVQMVAGQSATIHFEQQIEDQQQKDEAVNSGTSDESREETQTYHVKRGAKYPHLTHAQAIAAIIDLSKKLNLPIYMQDNPQFHRVHLKEPAASKPICDYLVKGRNVTNTAGATNGCRVCIKKASEMKRPDIKERERIIAAAARSDAGGSDGHDIDNALLTRPSRPGWQHA